MTADADRPSDEFADWHESWHRRLYDFVSAWEHGDEPQIELALQTAVSAELDKVFGHYLGAELEALLKKRRLPQIQDYLNRLVLAFKERLPTADEIIKAVFHEHLPRLPSHYRLDAILGNGGMGRVFRAHHMTLARDHAIKVMLPALTADAEFRKRFLREARAAAQLHHENIVTIHDAGEEDGIPYLAMELLEGQSLQQRLNSGSRFSITQILCISRGIAAGLAAAHERALVHRDIKPSNIWLESKPADHVKILDFGLARKEVGESQLTHTGDVCGTRAYIAPERASGGPASARADLFSLGCVMYYMATGRPPYYDTPPFPAPPPLGGLNVDLPGALVDLIEQLINVELARRPESAKEVCRRIDSVTDELTRRPSAHADPGSTTSGREPLQIDNVTVGLELPSADAEPLLGHLWEKALCMGEGAMVTAQRALLRTILANDYRASRQLTLLQREVWQQCSLELTNPFTTAAHVLLSGPTGSGKSTVAEMFLLATTVLNHYRCKAIYVAPTRALAQAKHRDLCQLLKGHRLVEETQVVLSTGEDTLDDAAIAQRNFGIACLVYEKANVLFSRNQEVLADIGLCVVDEMHMLADLHRGPTLELLLAKLLEQRQASEGKEDDRGDKFPLRVIGITTESRKDEPVISFFSYENRLTNRVDPPIHIDSPERPVPIDYSLVLPSRTPVSEKWTSNSGGPLPWDLFYLMTVDKDRHRELTGDERQKIAEQLAPRWSELVSNRKGHHENPGDELQRRLVAFLQNQLHHHPVGRRWMVFVPSKGGTESIANRLRKTLDGRDAFPDGVPATLLEALEDAEDREEAQTIERLARAGLFVHHSDIPHSVRRAIEEISNRPLESHPSQVLFCTETLSFGVNLAINDAIMLGTAFYSATRSEGSIESRDLPPCNLHNMAGRAGRLGRSDRDRANFYLFVPLEKQGKNVISLILERYFKDVPPLWSRLFVQDDKAPFKGRRTGLLRENKVDEYVKLGRLSAEDFSYPFVRSVLDVLRHRGIEGNCSADDLMDFFRDYTLYARQQLLPSAVNPARDYELEERLFRQAVEDTLVSCAASRLSLAKEASPGPPRRFAITQRGLAVIETGTEIASITPLLTLHRQLRQKWNEVAPGDRFPVELYLLAFVALNEVHRKFIAYTPELWGQEQPERKVREFGILNNKSKVRAMCEKALKVVGIPNAAKIAEICRQVLENTEAVQKITADYPNGGVESVLRGFTAMLLWVNGDKKSNVTRQIGWADPDIDSSRPSDMRRKHVAAFSQLCDQIAWRAVFLHRILTRGDERTEVQTEEQRDILLLAERIRLGAQTEAIPLFWPNGSRLRRDEAHELIKKGHRPVAMLTTNEPQGIDGVREQRLQQLKEDLTRYAWKQFQSLANTMQSRMRGKTETQSLCRLWDDSIVAMRQAAEDYRRPHSQKARVTNKFIDGLFRELMPRVVGAFAPSRATNRPPMEARTDRCGVELAEQLPGEREKGRRIFLFATQALPDWQMVTAFEGAGSASRMSFCHLLSSLKNDDRHPVAVCFPWKPSTTKAPPDVVEQLKWRSENRKPTLTFLTPAAALSALTLIVRGFVEPKFLLDLVYCPVETVATPLGFRVIRLCDILTSCDRHATDEYWGIPILREAMLRHFEADTP